MGQGKIQYLDLVPLRQVLDGAGVDAKRLVGKEDAAGTMGQGTQHQPGYLLLLVMVRLGAGSCSHPAHVASGHR